MILKNYGKENNRGSDFCMRMQQTDSVMFNDVLYHKKIASTHKQRKLQKLQIKSAHLYVTSEFLLLLAGCSKFSVCDAARSFVHVNGSKSAIRCILRSVRKPTLVIFGTFEVEKAYRIDLIL